MAQQKYREMGMDTMERLYYERQSFRKKRYAARMKKKPFTSNRVSVKRDQMGRRFIADDKAVKENLSLKIENMC